MNTNKKQTRKPSTISTYYFKIIVIMKKSWKLYLAHDMLIRAYLQGDSVFHLHVLICFCDCVFCLYFCVKRNIWNSYIHSTSGIFDANDAKFSSAIFDTRKLHFIHKPVYHSNPIFFLLQPKNSHFSRILCSFSRWIFELYIQCMPNARKISK